MFCTAQQLFLSLLLIFASGYVFSQGKTATPLKHDISEIWDPEVREITPGKTLTDAPSDAIILFNGRNLSDEWTNQDGGEPDWTVSDNCFTVVKGTGDIKTKRIFNDFQLHIEWRSPAEVVGEGQGRESAWVGRA